MLSRPTLTCLPPAFEPVGFDATARHSARRAAEAERVVAQFRQMAGGVHPRTCSLCGYHGLFSAFGAPPRLDARCPKCASLERHRLLALLVQREGLFGASDTVLHFAPEPPIRRLTQPRVARYETADLRPGSSIDHVVNIEATKLPNRAYTRVIANHVLEHVDDRAALAELFRILDIGGIALFTVPVIEAWDKTYECSDVRTRADRSVHFGQSDHRRYYGRDLRDRIRAAGFVIEEMTAVEPDIRIHGLIRGETIFVAQRPGTSPGA